MKNYNINKLNHRLEKIPGKQIKILEFAFLKNYKSHFKIKCELCNKVWDMYFGNIFLKKRCFMCKSCSKKSNPDINTKFYTLWQNMKKRVKEFNREISKDFKSYLSFKSYCITAIPDFQVTLHIINVLDKLKPLYKRLSLDRIDNLKGYIKGNIGFISQSENSGKDSKIGQSGYKYIHKTKNNTYKVSIRKVDLKIDKTFKNINEALEFRNDI
jgi:phage FluMu protein Com